MDINTYNFAILVDKDSYYYSLLGKKESIPVNVTIKLQSRGSQPDPKAPETPIDPTISILDELRTKLKIILH